MTSHGRGYIEYESADVIGEQAIDVVVAMNYEEFEDTWEIEFSIGGNYRNRFPKTTMKETIQILNVVASAVDDFITNDKPNNFFFTESTGMKGGMKLYVQFAKQITKRYPYDVRKSGKIFEFTRWEQ